jgi:CheY-like chemotaxis protein
LARLAHLTISMAARRPRVLLIDDDSGVRELVRYLIESFGYDCGTAEDGVTGLARFDEERWDIVLTDLAMPGMNGWEVVETLRQRSSTVPVVLLTGLADSGVVQRAAARRVTLLSKPFLAETLRAALTRGSSQD